VSLLALTHRENRWISQDGGRSSSNSRRRSARERQQRRQQSGAAHAGARAPQLASAVRSRKGLPPSVFRKVCVCVCARARARDLSAKRVLQGTHVQKVAMLQTCARAGRAGDGARERESVKARARERERERDSKQEVLPAT
jgi:hypothetical protein